MKSITSIRSGWFFRPVILFATAYLIIGIVHESAHALTAYALDVPFTLFHYAVNLARDRGPLIDPAIIGVAGPLSALIVGLICWFFYGRARGSRSELLLLYLSVFGAGHFIGNLIGSVGFVGDFSGAVLSLGLPMGARYVASVIGILSVCGLHFMAGWILCRQAPAGSSRLRAMIVMVVIPVLAGAAIVTLASLPIPAVFVFGRLAEASFWVFAAVGVLMSRNTPSGTGLSFQLSWADAAILAAAVIVVRVMAGGITFQR